MTFIITSIIQAILFKIVPLAILFAVCSLIVVSTIGFGFLYMLLSGGDDSE